MGFELELRFTYTYTMNKIFKKIQKLLGAFAFKINKNMIKIVIKNYANAIFYHFQQKMTVNGILNPISLI